MPQVTGYTARFSTPDFLARGEAQTLEMPIYRDGALVVPSGGEYRVLDENGDAVQTGSVTVASSIATFALLAATVPATLALSTRWQIEWTLTIGGTAFTFMRDAHLVLRRLWPVVTDLDLTRLHSELRAWLADDSTDLQDYIDATWDEVLIWLLQQGRRPYLILSAWSLRAWHVALALAAVFRDYASSAGDGKYRQLAEHYDAAAVTARDALVLVYDDDEDNVIDATDEGLSGSSVLMLSTPGRWVAGVL
jgi:hypothetical protein